MSDFDKERTGTGTREWSDHSFNIMTGCEHDCKYCYAKANAVRFKRCTDSGWKIPGIDYDKIARAKKKFNGVVMFPTTHDITPDTILECATTLFNLLEAGNQVLVVSKPHLPCIELICRDAESFKSQIQFRFTIGSWNDDTSKFWEPGAPLPAERFLALRCAFDNGFKTSVSMEPMLDSVDETILSVERMDPFVTDTIWIGKMNRVPMVDEFWRNKILAQQVDAEIMRLAWALKDHTKVRWKDSIKKVIAKYDNSNKKDE